MASQPDSRRISVKPRVPALGQLKHFTLGGRTKVANRVLQPYYVFFNDEGHIPEPAYYFVGKFTGKNPKDALKRNLSRLIRTTRKIIQFGNTEGDDYKLERGLHVVPVEHWMSARDAYWQASVAHSEKSE